MCESAQYLRRVKDRLCLTVWREHIEVETVLAELDAIVWEEFQLETQLVMVLEAVAVLHASRLVGGVSRLVPGR